MNVGLIRAAIAARRAQRALSPELSGKRFETVYLGEGSVMFPEPPVLVCSDGTAMGHTREHWWVTDVALKRVISNMGDHLQVRVTDAGVLQIAGEEVALRQARAWAGYGKIALTPTSFTCDLPLRVGVDLLPFTTDRAVSASDPKAYISFDGVDEFSASTTGGATAWAQDRAAGRLITQLVDEGPTRVGHRLYHASAFAVAAAVGASRASEWRALARGWQETRAASLVKMDCPPSGPEGFILCEVPEPPQWPHDAWPFLEEGRHLCRPGLAVVCGSSELKQALRKVKKDAGERGIVRLDLIAHRLLAPGAWDYVPLDLSGGLVGPSFVDVKHVDLLHAVSFIGTPRVRLSVERYPNAMGVVGEGEDARQVVIPVTAQ